MSLRQRINPHGLKVIGYTNPVVIISVAKLIKSGVFLIKMDFCRQLSETSDNILVCIKSEKRDGFKSGAERLCFFNNLYKILRLQKSSLKNLMVDRTGIEPARSRC